MNVQAPPHPAGISAGQPVSVRYTQSESKRREAAMVDSSSRRVVPNVSGAFMKILVVDDHPLIREALRHVLVQLDGELDLLDAPTCEAAKEVAAQHPDIDLVLFDLGLPGVSGTCALEAFRDAHPHLPIVVLSATDDHDVVLDALDRGAMGFIPKTSSNELMLSALRLVVSGGIYVPPQALSQAGERPESAAAKVPPAPSAPPLPGSGLLDPAEVGLTGRQADVLALMVQGKPNKLICRELNLAEGTVKVHITAILRTLNVANRTQAVIAVSRLGLRLPTIARKA